MKSKNTVSIVTPPDLHIPVIGPTVLLLGTTMDDSKEYTDVYERLFPEVEITFFVSDNGFPPSVAAWFRAAAGMSSSIFVNIDNITAEEVFLAMQAEHENRAVVFWLSQKQKYPAMVSLLNSYQYQVFGSLDEIEKFLIDEHIKM